MSGVKGKSGRKPHTMSVMEVVAALHRLTPKAVKVIEQHLEEGNYETAKLVIEHVKGRPAQTTTLLGDAKMPLHIIVEYVARPLPDEQPPGAAR